MLSAGQAFVHLDDLTDAIEKVVERCRDLPSELPLLVGESEALGYTEVQDIVGCTLHGEGWDMFRVPQPIAKAGAWVQNEMLGEDSSIKSWMVEASNGH